jgi:ubiquinone/menaquinone biosynthesis C-methylase UbiE
MLKLNVGCGPRIFKGYDNLDLYVEHPEIIKMDVDNLSSYADGSVDEVLAQDILEHFPRLKWKRVIAEWVRVLKVGGLLVLQFPDMVTLCNHLLEAKTADQWEFFNRKIFGGQGDGKGLPQDEVGMFHFTGFTDWYLKEYLETTHSLTCVSSNIAEYNCRMVMQK